MTVTTAAPVAWTLHQHKWLWVKIPTSAFKMQQNPRCISPSEVTAVQSSHETLFQLRMATSLYTQIPKIATLLDWQSDRTNLKGIHLHHPIIISPLVVDVS
jgi:streptomycin 6-kinase